MLSFTAQKSIMDFIVSTQSDSHNYRLQILYELSSAFGFTRAIFTLENYPGLTIGLGIPEDMLNEYISFYHTVDYFSGRHKPSDAVIIAGEGKDSEFRAGEYYGGFLASYEMEYVLCMPLYANKNVGPLLGTIEIFRMREEGEFTAMEIECLEVLSCYIANNLNYRVQLHKMQRDRNLLKGSLQFLPIGYILADSDFHITYYNKTAREYALQFSHGLNHNPIEDLHAKLLPLVRDASPQFGHTIRADFPPLAIEINAFWSQDSLLETTVKDYVIYLMRKDAISSVDAKKLLNNYRLTRRELEIASLLLKGYSNDEISRELHISYNTVKVHLKSIYGKIDVSSRPAAMSKLGNLHVAL